MGPAAPPARRTAQGEVRGLAELHALVLVHDRHVGHHSTQHRQADKQVKDTGLRSTKTAAGPMGLHTHPLAHGHVVRQAAIVVAHAARVADVARRRVLGAKQPVVLHLSKCGTALGPVHNERGRPKRAMIAHRLLHKTGVWLPPAQGDCSTGWQARAAALTNPLSRMRIDSMLPLAAATCRGVSPALTSVQSRSGYSACGARKGVRAPPCGRHAWGHAALRYGRARSALPGLTAGSSDPMRLRMSPPYLVRRTGPPGC